MYSATARCSRSIGLSATAWIGAASSLVRQAHRRLNPGVQREEEEGRKGEHADQGQDALQCCKSTRCVEERSVHLNLRWPRLPARMLQCSGEFTVPILTQQSNCSCS
jgi:hypothetical protein